MGWIPVIVLAICFWLLLVVLQVLHYEDLKVPSFIPARTEESQDLMSLMPPFWMTSEMMVP